jgi:hypothetical protein
MRGFAIDIVARGEADGSLRKGMDPLHLYVGLVSLARLINRMRTRSYGFSRLICWRPTGKGAQKQAHEMVHAFLAGAGKGVKTPAKSLAGVA